MKKRAIRTAICSVLALAMLACCGFTNALYTSPQKAMSIFNGVDALNTQFQSGTGPKAGGYALDYEYYQPTTGSESYPLVIWLHGMGHGEYPGSQIEDNDISKWTSAEYQSRFEGAGGAYILCPRAPEDEGVYWWPDDLTASLKALIDRFVLEHPDVDTDRIYIGGFSLGGNMTVQMCLAYPDYFAAAFPVCPALGLNYDLSSISQLPVWMVACSNDPMVPYKGIVCSFWDDLTEATDVAASCRFSTVTRVYRSNGRRADSNHQVWNLVTSDMFMDNTHSYQNTKTVNGYDKTVTLSYPDGMISWLSEQSK